MPMATPWNASFMNAMGRGEEATVRQKDHVVVTLGSMTEASSLGSMDQAPVLKGKSDGGAWALWEKIADGKPQFGHPANFTDHIEESKWVSFSTTLYDPNLLPSNPGTDRKRSRRGRTDHVFQSPVGWLRSYCPISRTSSGSRQMLRSSGDMVFSSTKPGDFVNKPMSAMHRTRDHGGDSWSPENRGRGAKDT